MKERIPLTTEETIALNALHGCTFPVASWDKRFVRSLSGMTGLTDKERPQIWRLFIRYRRQISCERKAELLRLAETLAAPDLRKLAAAQQEQNRIDQLRKRYQEQMTH